MLQVSRHGLNEVSKMVKMKLTDYQNAVTYAIYEIAGSYFKKTTCNNILLEQKLRVQFFEQKMEEQEKLEEECDRYVQEHMLEALAPYWDHEVFVRLLPDKETDTARVRFETDDFIVCMEAHCVGKRATFSHKLLVKDPSK